MDGRTAQLTRVDEAGSHVLDRPVQVQGGHILAAQEDRDMQMRDILATDDHVVVLCRELAGRDGWLSRATATAEGTQ